MKKTTSAAAALALLASLSLSTPAMADDGGRPRLCTTSMNFVYNMMNFLAGTHAWTVLFGAEGKCKR